MEHISQAQLSPILRCKNVTSYLQLNGELRSQKSGSPGSGIRKPTIPLLSPVPRQRLQNASPLPLQVQHLEENHRQEFFKMVQRSLQTWTLIIRLYMAAGFNAYNDSQGRSKSPKSDRGETPFTGNNKELMRQALMQKEEVAFPQKRSYSFQYQGENDCHIMTYHCGHSPFGSIARSV